jgi:hypothetical protein
LLSASSVGAEPEGLYEAGSSSKFNDASILKTNGVEFGGWLEVGIAGNPDDPDDDTNGPVTFNNDANEIHMNELYGFVERVAPTDGGWSIGFRADLLYGTDARFSPTSNLDDKLLNAEDYKLVFPQTYVEIYTPIGNGLTTKVGHFYTIIGYSIVVSRDISDQLHYVLQHDFGTEDKSQSTPKNTKWYGINQYLTYDYSDALAAGLRFEWFRDEGGTRVTGIDDHFFGITAGLNYTVTPWLKVRPELRYDWTAKDSQPFDIVRKMVKS